MVKACAFLMGNRVSADFPNVGAGPVPVRRKATIFLSTNPLIKKCKIMKKLFFTLVAAMMAATATFAQSTLVATLTHGENVTMYYGT